MPRTAMKWDKGLATYKLAVDPKKMDAAVKKHLRRASGLNGKLAEKAARKVIQSSSGLESNKALTIAIKGEDKPLVGLTGELFRAITSKVVSDTTVFVGVLRTDGAFNVARIVHDGVTIPVSPAMRGMFFYLWKASEGELNPTDLTGRAAELWDKMPGGWLPLAESTTAIVIPSRPFMDLAFKTAGLKKQTHENWKMALQAAMRERATAAK